MTRDSDIAPAVRMVRALFPDKDVTIIAPPNRGHSSEILAAQPPPLKAKLRRRHIERCLLPELVQDAGGNVAAQRPAIYNPPP